MLSLLVQTRLQCDDNMMQILTPYAFPGSIPNMWQGGQKSLCSPFNSTNKIVKMKLLRLVSFDKKTTQNK